ncbi:B3/B4 domain-containing protein [Pannonibacter tanglangensis]|uniref:B3/B4 tRNA-binding domain-containing protein n=1 Tax=Pannonibacter tanglangensis TaxID=2750084 RepID=A0ABW9ZG88_9HYPH|nr:phenylalanine--tRNA ligase beta subunit-related protein [Pannonibacter sp. XCT-34]NBN63859.1 hypothetical protein [Pannonibacter sp. XCT-34]
MQHFSHDPALLDRFPDLRVGARILTLTSPLFPEALDPTPHLDRARARLDRAPESEFTSIRAWRAAYAAMGFKPTQYRSAAEALLRRLRIDGALPNLHPVIDFGNAVSAAHGIPLAIFDLGRITGNLTVTFARGDEAFESFGGAQEPPEAGEVIYRDDTGEAHARRWVHRQGQRSAFSPATRQALLVAEALHPGADADVDAMMSELERAFTAAGASLRQELRWDGTCPAP